MPIATLNDLNGKAPSHNNNNQPTINPDLPPVKEERRLPKPILSAVCERRRDARNPLFNVGYAGINGHRTKMEDHHLIFMSTNHDDQDNKNDSINSAASSSSSSSSSSSCPPWGFFGVFDGHSGAACSHYVEQAFSKFCSHIHDTKKVVPPLEDNFIRETCLAVDEKFLTENPENPSGSAATFFLAHLNSSRQEVDCEKNDDDDDGDGDDDDKDQDHNTTAKVVGNDADDDGGGGDVLAAKKKKQKNKPAAAAATVHLQVGNIGDSRVLVSHRGGVCTAMTEDHKPEIWAERRRIEMAHGFVMNNRVNGGLAMSRSFGDGKYKQRVYPGGGVPSSSSSSFSSSFQPSVHNDNNASHQKQQELENFLRHHAHAVEQQVNAVADITHVDLSLDGSDFAVVACDGVFEGNFSNQEVIAFINDMFRNGEKDLVVAANKVCQEALKRGSRDNISVMIVQFGGGDCYSSSSSFDQHDQSSSKPADNEDDDKKLTPVETDSSPPAAAAAAQSPFIPPPPSPEHLTSPLPTKAFLRSGREFIPGPFSAPRSKLFRETYFKMAHQFGNDMSPGAALELRWDLIQARRRAAASRCGVVAAALGHILPIEGEEEEAFFQNGPPAVQKTGSLLMGAERTAWFDARLEHVLQQVEADRAKDAHFSKIASTGKTLGGGGGGVGGGDGSSAGGGSGAAMSDAAVRAARLARFAPKKAEPSSPPSQQRPTTTTTEEEFEPEDGDEPQEPEKPFDCADDFFNFDAMANSQNNNDDDDDDGAVVVGSQERSVKEDDAEGSTPRTRPVSPVDKKSTSGSSADNSSSGDDDAAAASFAPVVAREASVGSDGAS